MLTVKVTVVCLNNEFHVIRLHPNGSLSFDNHNPKELYNLISLVKIGGHHCGCSKFLEQWRENKLNDIPRKMADQRAIFNKFGHNIRWVKRRNKYRNFKQLNEKKYIKDLTERIEKVTRKDYCETVINLIKQELINRGYCLTDYQLNNNPTFAINGCIIYLSVVFKPLNNISATVRFFNNNVEISSYVNNKIIAYVVNYFADVIEYEVMRDKVVSLIDKKMFAKQKTNKNENQSILANQKEITDFLIKSESGLPGGFSVNIPRFIFNKHALKLAMIHIEPFIKKLKILESKSLENLNKEKENQIYKGIYV